MSYLTWQNGMLEGEVSRLKDELAAERKRREEAERERDEACSYMSAYKDAAERAEADNAALLADLRSMHEVAQGVMRHEQRERIRYAILDRMDAPHPGAALLERMRALEAFVAGVPGLVIRDMRRMVESGSASDAVRSACAAYDALKVPRE